MTNSESGGTMASGSTALTDCWVRMNPNAKVEPATKRVSFLENGKVMTAKLQKGKSLHISV
jgi:hypothetical protein